jgi:hypothetical protein
MRITRIWRMKRIRSVFLLILLSILVGCRVQALPSPAPTEIKSPTPMNAPLQMAAATNTPVPTSTIPAKPTPASRRKVHAPTATPIATATYAPSEYRLKRPILLFGTTSDGISTNFTNLDSRLDIEMALYEDGQLLIQHGTSPMMETTITTPEICQLLARIKHTGFFNLQSSADPYQDKTLYHLDRSFEGSSDAPSDIIVVNGQAGNLLWIYQPLEQYLVPQGKQILSLLRSYQPKNLHRYQPDRYLVGVALGDLTQGYEAVSQVNSWPSFFPPSEELRIVNGETAFYIEKKAAKEAGQLFPKGAGLVTIRGTEYTVLLFPLLPHQLPNDLDHNEELLTEPLPFTCQ